MDQGDQVDMTSPDLSTDVSFADGACRPRAGHRHDVTVVNEEALPSGTVTLLFSDMEGSTALLSRLGDDYAAVLDGHRKVFRAALADHNGVEMGTEGDSFYTVFASAVEAVSAAVAAQLGLAARQWPAGVSVNVRIGVHTGSPSIHGGAYIGVDVHRAARIANAAHGGQVLISAATAELVAHSLPDGVTLRDLGMHTLKDMPSPLRLVQLEIAGLRSEFPSLRTLGSATSLPSVGNRLVGRETEMVELGALLTGTPGCSVRLVTLTGPGGSGKTRLGAAVAKRLVDRFADGVFFVPLESAFSADAMWASIGEGLDLPPESRRAPRLLDAIAPLRLLLVLDNLEQIPAADTVVAELLDRAAHITVLATTRRALRLRYEHEYPVLPLQLPRMGDDAAQSGAVALFVAQAQRVRPAFTLTAANVADVAAVCRSLDGLPLAIELTAARSKLLSPRALLARLDHVLDLSIAAVDRPARHQTLRQTIDWSYQLLSDKQRSVFCIVAIFAGATSIDAVETIVQHVHAHEAIDILTIVGDLVDASLITIVETAEGEPLVTLLDTVRAYARDRLTASADGDSVARAHAEYYRALVATLYAQSFGAEQRRARERFVTEQENIVAALHWTLAGSHAEDGANYVSRIRLGVGLCADSLTAWARESQLVTAGEWATRAITLSADRDWVEAATCRIRWANCLCQAGGDIDGAEQYARASIDLLTRMGDTDHMPDALKTLGWIYLERGELDTACAFFDEALERSRKIVNPGAGIRYIIRFCHMAIGWANLMRSNFDEALARFAVQERGARADLDFEDTLAAQHNTACTLRLMGRAGEAVEHFQRIIPMSFEMNQLYHLIVLCEDYAAALTETGAFANAARLIGGADQLRIRHALQRPQAQKSEVEPAIVALKSGLGEQDWAINFAIGMATPIDVLLSRA